MGILDVSGSRPQKLNRVWRESGESLEDLRLATESIEAISLMRNASYAR